ncbi:MAG: hypothetical protein IJP02_02125 [Oscillospiraceae bacterium]|nr:hypothetical protein [Oscillospiraceae bacterium]
MQENKTMPLTVGQEGGRPIGQEEIRRAAEILRRYKAGKANLEQRIVDDELWWELRHWQAIGRSRGKNIPKATSAWLFNAITNKHADAMDNYPEPVVLPREPSDEGAARALGQVLPVVLEQNDFEQAYSDGWWEKLKHGTAAYGVFWNSRKDNGLGDIDIRPIDLLKLFWQPGVTDIQDSRNLFLVELADRERLEEQYPQLRGKAPGDEVDVKQYLYDDNVDNSDKCVVVDWYYKVADPSGRRVLHYVKFVGDQLLFASENDPRYRHSGWYEHGLYPVVLDVLFPEKGTPAGFGYVAVCKDPQLYIDDLSSRVLTSAMMQTTPRWFVSEGTAINTEQLLDWNETLVKVAGPLDENRLRQFSVDVLDGSVLSVLQMKIDEMKETAGNRDVNAGGTMGGVTAASAIAALQEAGSKTSRDMLAGSYRAMVQMCRLCVELMRQFYEESRAFRVLGKEGEYAFVRLSNDSLRDRVLGVDGDGLPLYRRPVFDLKIRAQKKNPFTRAEQNERAKELYRLGFFDPNRAGEALGALEMMEFEGVEQVRQSLQAALSRAGTPTLPHPEDRSAGGDTLQAREAKAQRQVR